jgi:PKD repeat protein
MSDKKRFISVRSGFVLVVVASILTSIAFIATPVKADWIPYVTLHASPDEVFPGETVTFTYNLSVESIPGSFGVQINSVKVKFAWDSQGVEICPVQVNMTPLPAYHVFQRTVTIPQSLEYGSQSATITIVGKAVGDWLSSSQTWSHEYVASPQLQAGVTGTPSNGIAPLSVSFASMVTGGTSPYQYYWSFGDGGWSSLQEPTHVYSSPGTFEARMTATDDHSRSVNDTLTITVYAPLTVSIEADKISGSVPLTVDFTSDVNGGSGGYAYSWNFGDGGTSTLPNPTHTFTSKGTFTVTLTVHDSKMNGKFASMTIDATVLQVTVSANPASGAVPLSVDFSSTVSGGSGGYTYQWAFGDGSTSNVPDPTHVYADPGTYTAYLTVTDSSSSTASSNSIHITVSASGEDEGNGDDGGNAGGGSNVGVLVAIAILAIALMGVAFFALTRKKK